MQARNDLVQEKLASLDNFFFESDNSIFNLWESTLLRQVLRDKGESDFELSRLSTREIREFFQEQSSEHRQVMSDRNKLRLRMAQGVIRSAPHNGLVRLQEHLMSGIKHGGYSEHELKDPYYYLDTMYDRWRLDLTQ